jgi:hypothetical protein
MKLFSRSLASAVVIAVTGATAVRADDDGFRSQRNAYVVDKLVSDQSGVANFQDPVLRNAWGVAFTPNASPSGSPTTPRVVPPFTMVLG